MGTYYIIVDDDKKEYIDPGQIDGGGIKYGAVMYGESSRLIAYMIMDQGWSRIRILGDFSDEYEELQASYRNVSLEAVRGYNEGTDRKISWNPDALTLSAYDRLDADAKPEAVDLGREIVLRRLTKLFSNDPKKIEARLVRHKNGVWVVDSGTSLIPRDETVDALVIGYATGWAEAMEKKET